MRGNLYEAAEQKGLACVTFRQKRSRNYISLLSSDNICIAVPLRYVSLDSFFSPPDFRCSALSVCMFIQQADCLHLSRLTVSIVSLNGARSAACKADCNLILDQFTAVGRRNWPVLQCRECTTWLHWRLREKLVFGTRSHRKLLSCGWEIVINR